MGRHRPAEEPAPPPRRRLLALAAADAVLATAALAMLVPQADVQPAAAPTVAIPTDRADDSGARAGRYQRPVPPTIVPTDAPVWEPAKGPVIVDGQPLKRTTAPRPAVKTKAPPPQPPPPPAAREPEPAPPTVGLPPVIEPVTPVDDAQPATDEPSVAEQPPDTPADILDELTDPEPTQQPAQEPTP